VNAARYLALSGGVGGAKLVAGLAQVLPADALTVAVNVGDDFEHLGLTICPDLDTVLYTLAGVVQPQQGWGRADESWNVLEELRRLGGASWFALGDRDIALHLLRRQLLQQGFTLSQASVETSRRLGVAVTVVPVSDHPVRTLVATDQGRLAFQDYFVRLRCEPQIRSLEFEGAAAAPLAPAVRAALENPELAGVILCPSNPYLSVAPMLAVTELRERLRALTVPVLAVSPIVAGQAIKGPTAKIMRELGVQPTAGVIADLYADFVDAVIVDTADAALAAADRRFVVAPTVMHTLEQKAALARACLALIGQLQSKSKSKSNSYSVISAKAETHLNPDPDGSPPTRG
jgi:LPPG:FO 2-phospho-L-lactate transferase